MLSQPPEGLPHSLHQRGLACSGTAVQHNHKAVVTIVSQEMGKLFNGSTGQVVGNISNSAHGDLLSVGHLQQCRQSLFIHT